MLASSPHPLIPTPPSILFVYLPSSSPIARSTADRPVHTRAAQSSSSRPPIHVAPPAAAPRTAHRPPSHPPPTPCCSTPRLLFLSFSFVCPSPSTASLESTRFIRHLIRPSGRRPRHTPPGPPSYPPPTHPTAHTTMRHNLSAQSNAHETACAHSRGDEQLAWNKQCDNFTHNRRPLARAQLALDVQCCRL
jgi:hypothetical protein